MPVGTLPENLEERSYTELIHLSIWLRETYVNSLVSSGSPYQSMRECNDSA